MPHSERRILLHAFIDRIEAQPVENHGIELTICWRGESRDVVTLARQACLKKSGGLEAARYRWRKEELALLLDMLDNGATKMEIALAFLYRKWARLRAKISELRGKDFDIPGDKPMRYEETFEMYEERIRNEKGIEFHDANIAGSRPSMMTGCFLNSSCWKGHRPG